MTKKVRIENADTSSHKVLVQTWEKTVVEGEPDILISEKHLPNPTDITGDETYITSTRYLVIKEIP